jgi:hypothetical protein
MSIEVLAIGSDNLVRLDSLTNTSSAAYINNATVSFTLTDANGNTVGSLSNVTMSYVSGSNGRYEGIVPSSTTLVLNALYTVTITATGGGYTIFRKLSCIAKYRSSQ